MEAGGVWTDQLHVLMFKFNPTLTEKRAAGGWRNENSTFSEKEDTAFAFSLVDIQYVVPILTDTPTSNIKC